MLWLEKLRNQRLTPETLEKIKQLLEDGATVIGGRPEVNASLSGGEQADERFKEILSALWGANPEESGDRKIGKGRLLWGDSLGESLQKTGVLPDVIGARSDVFIHRTSPDKEIYFVTAGHEDPMDANLQFRTKGKPSFMDPLTGKTIPVKIYSRTETHTVVPIKLPIAGSVFVVFDKETESSEGVTKVSFKGEIFVDASDLSRVYDGQQFPILKYNHTGPIQPWVDPLPLEPLDLRDLVAWEDGEVVFKRGKERIKMTVAGTQSRVIGKEWTVDFPEGWDTVKNLKMKAPQPWTDLGDAATKAFSGTASYQTSFTLGKISAGERYLIDLGRVDDIAEVLVNGKKVATLWAPPFRVEVSKFVNSGLNQLEVKVTNTWNNRLAYDASLPKAKQKTWTTRMKAVLKAEPQSGLSGPVLLRKGQSLSLE